MRHIGRFALTCLIGVLSPVAHADISAEMAEAITPLSEMKAAPSRAKTGHKD